MTWLTLRYISSPIPIKLLLFTATLITEARTTDRFIPVEAALFYALTCALSLFTSVTIFEFYFFSSRYSHYGLKALENLEGWATQLGMMVKFWKSQVSITFRIVFDDLSIL